MNISDFEAIGLQGEDFFFIDQTKLPFEVLRVVTDSYERIAVAIERLEIRGAPAIGVAAAYALALSLKKNKREEFPLAYERLRSTRPTAVNLFHGLNKIKSVFENGGSYDDCLTAAIVYHNEDRESCRRISNSGAELLKRKKHPITICNTGAFAVGGEGTALGVIKQMHQLNPLDKVTACETRPLLQGARLTAFELDKAGIPFRIIVDSASAFFLSQGEIDFCITGADRIAANGDSANKIGTLMLAQLCKVYGVPFYIAAPFSTIDSGTASGTQIPVEFRSPLEISRIRDVDVTLSTFPFENPAFDVTPAELITGIITDFGVYSFPYNFKI